MLRAKVPDVSPGMPLLEANVHTVSTKQSCVQKSFEENGSPIKLYIDKKESRCEGQLAMGKPPSLIGTHLFQKSR